MSPAPRTIAVSLNPAVDRSLTVPGFAVDRVNRIAASRTDPGGKGVNVACFLAHLGQSVALAGLLGRETAALFTRQFAAMGVTDITVPVAGATRTNLKILDPDAGTVTDLNGPGPAVTAADVTAVRRALEHASAGGLDWLVLSGSLPDGLPPDTYADLIAWGRARGARVVLDTSGAALAEGIGAGPDILKPNRAELEALMGHALPDMTAVVASAGRLVAGGVGLVVVSLGPGGAVVRDRDGAWLAVPPAVPVASTVGAGDALVAGLIHATAQGLPVPEAARVAVGVSAAALGEIGPRLPALDHIEALAARVTVTPLETDRAGPRR
ncbi:1-phosphofructokinase [Roseospira navarrensis]|uniref:Phosphofructokinase n=1 Tax=Roseospira navarrensis TaxID=140058 RepID=A0A7X2D3P1_9PROT|nr:1-phosphofructokinase [Roseospira navarrensis]MQX35827.1 1-phosphofructokinase [Roseospira navarrensis]